MKLRRILSCVMALLLVCSLPVSAFADTWYLEDGDVTVSATESGQTVSQGETSKNDDAPVITQKDSTTSTTNTITIKAEENATANVTIQDMNIVIIDPSNGSGKAAVTIDVVENAEANVTLDGVSIDASGTGNDTGSGPISGKAAVQIVGNGDVTLELDGENTVQSGHMRAGVEKNTTAATETEAANGTGKLIITDETGTDGSLEATGGYRGAGIGGGVDGIGSNITITGSAEVTANGGVDAAGIGGGLDGSGSNITITGSAEVTAQGNVGGAGIGGGSFGIGSSITITGSAEVTAKGDISGAGIGGGIEGSGSNITVSEDAQVKAQGGNGYHSEYDTIGAGAAIGDGGKYSYGSPDNIAGEEKKPNSEGLNEGWVATYAPGTTDLDTATPDSLTYKGASNVAGAQPIAKQEPTCTEVGHEAGFSVDGAVVAVTIPKTGHSFTNYIPDSEATCTADATKTARCDHDGCDITDTISVPGTKKPHSMGEYYTTLEATCQAKGVERRDCDNCDYSETRTLDKLEHSFTNYISNNDATYDADGTKTAVCDTCDATDTIPDPGSRLVREEIAQVEPLYRVLGQDGKALACKTEQSSGVLTITVEADFASLTGKLSGIKTLKAQGIDTIVFVTNGVTSTFALSDLLAQSGDGYTLTHDGEKVTFILSSGADIGKILK